MFVGSAEATVLLTVLVFVGAVAAVSRACFASHPDGAANRLALLWCAAFAVQVLGALMARDIAGSGGALLWSALAAVMAVTGATALGRHWREQAMEREVMKLRSREVLARERENIPTPHTGGESGMGDDRPPSSSAPAVDTIVLCASAARDYDLTRREEDVLVLLAQGRTAAEVAEELVVSPNTVKTHVRNLYRKLGINRRCDLASRLGL